MAGRKTGGRGRLAGVCSFIYSGRPVFPTARSSEIAVEGLFPTVWRENSQWRMKGRFVHLPIHSPCGLHASHSVQPDTPGFRAFTVESEQAPRIKNPLRIRPP